MTSNKDTSTDASTNFVLKHRITGAAFLICFGVLFLPWLLGAPSEANKDNAGRLSQNGGEITQDQIEQELLTVVDNAQIENVEVYVSKITPLDGLPSSNSASEQQEPAEPQAEKTNSEEISISTPALVKPKVTKPVPVVVAEKETAEVEPTTTPELVKTTEKIEPTIIDNKVEVGWVVQVGVFTDSDGAEKVVSDLESRGFNPSTTIVDTNQGKASGTRVWLGPYSQRVNAAKSMATLKDKTGSDGFIRAYP